MLGYMFTEPRIRRCMADEMYRVIQDDCWGFNTLETGDADLRFYRVLQSFGSYITTARRVTQICVFTRGWIPRTLHLITQYMEPFFE
jgi:hypothetical protein